MHACPGPAIARRARARPLAGFLLAALGAGVSSVPFRAQSPAADISFADARPVFDALRRETWPAAFAGRDLAAVEAAWPEWVRAEQEATRVRLAEGDADSVAHLALFGTSFTTRPRPDARVIAALATNPDEAVAALGGRLDDLTAAARAPGGNARMTLVRSVLARAGIALEDRQAVRRHLASRLREVGRAGAGRLAALASPGASPFADRGLSTDTALAVDYGVDAALAAVRTGALLDPGRVGRVAVVGPGLDYIDKQSGYDFYPEQTLQPFAVIDALRRTGLAAADGVAVVTFDVSPRVNAHISDARDRALGGGAYRVTLARGLDRVVPPGFLAYWTAFGDRIGARAPSPAAPPGAGRVAVRAVDVAPEVVRAITPRELHVILQRPAGDAPFDLVVATNVLLYYGVFEQALALANVAAILRPGGVLLTNTPLVEIPGVPMTVAGVTDVVYASLPGIGEVGDRMHWYRRTP